MKLVTDLQKVIDKSRSLKPARLWGRFIPSQSISLSPECIGSLKSGSMNALSPPFLLQSTTSCIFFICSSCICNSVAVYSELGSRGWSLGFIPTESNGMACSGLPSLEPMRCSGWQTEELDLYGPRRQQTFPGAVSHSAVGSCLLHFFPCPCVAVLLPPVPHSSSFLSVYWLWIRKLRLV